MNLFAAIETKDVLNQLMNIHGADWNAIIQSDSDKVEIKTILSGIIKKSIDPTQFGFETDLVPDIIGNAVGEYGHFVDLNNSGGMSAADTELFQDYKKEAEADPTSREALSWYYGLQNAANPDSLKMLADALDYTDDPSTSFTIGRNISTLLEGTGHIKTDPGLDFAYIDQFTPNLKKPYYKRNGKWKEVVKYSARKLKDSYLLVKDVSTDKDFLKEYKKIGNNVFSLTKLAKDNSASSEIMIAQKNTKEVKREIASENDQEVKREINSQEEEQIVNQASNRLPIYFLALGLFFLSFILFRRFLS